jgi:hypothetical protein
LCSIIKEQKESPFLKKNKIGSFFVKQSSQKEILDYVMSSEELKVVEEDIQNNIRGSKIQR